MNASQLLELHGKFFLFPRERDVLYGFARVWDPRARLHPEDGEDFLSELDGEVQRRNYLSAARLALQQNLLEVLIEGGKIRKEAGFVWDLPHLGLRFPDLRKRYPDSDGFVDEVFRYSELIDGYLMDEAAGLSDLEPVTHNREGIRNLRQQLPTRFLERYDEHNPKSVLVYSLEPFVEGEERAESAVHEPVVKKTARKRAPLVAYHGDLPDEAAEAIESGDYAFVRAVGPSILERAAQMADAKPLVNIIELFGSNPYDKDATVVNLWYDPVAGTFISEDDGSGMTPDDLPEFFLSGDSSKGDPSPIYGRLPHGDFGMAAINLKNLCRQYTMVTVKDGFRTTLSEEFRGPLQLGKIIRPDKVERCSEDEHGTKFVLSGLKFDRGFDLRALRTQIQWDLPVADPTFDIYINDSVVEPPKIKGLASFLYILNGKHMGDVKAVLHVMGRNHEHSGMNVYVRGRRIGLPGALLEYGERRLSFRKRIVGMIDASGLRDAIQVERRAFNESKASFKELRRKMDPILSDVVRYAASHFSESSGEILRRNEASTVVSIRRRLVGAKLLGRHKASVELVDPNEVGFDSDLPGRLDNNRLLLNRNRASLHRTSKTTSGDFKARLLGTAIEVIASERLPEEASAADLVAETDRIWRRLCSSSGSDVSERAANEEQELEDRSEDTSHPHLLYPSSRVLKDMGIAAPDLRYLRSKQVIAYTGDLLLGSDVREVQKRMGLYTVSLRRLVQAHHHTPKGDIQTEQRFEEKLGLAENTIEPFIVNLHRETGKPSCYFTMPLCVEPLNSLFASAAFRRRGSDRFRRAFEGFGAEAYTPVELAEYTHLARDEVDAVIHSAKLQGSPLTRLSGKRRGVFRYRFKDFVGVYRHYVQIKAQQN